MRVLVLAWGVEPGPLGPSPQAAGLAVALAAADHDVRLVTRADGDEPLVLDGVEVHAVTDPPPIVPTAMRDPVLDALGVAGRATSVAVRRLEERTVDVVHAEGWPTAPVVTALRRSHPVPVLAVVEDAARAAAAGTTAELAASLVAAADAHLRRAPGAPLHLPPGTHLRPRRPGPPPPSGPVHLRAGPGVAHHLAADQLRSALSAPRRISHTWGRRPAVVVVLDPADLDTVVRGFATGVPVVAVPGPTGDLVAAAGAGVVVADAAPAVVADAVDRLLADPARAAALGAAAATAATDHDWRRVAADWARLAATTSARATGPRLHAAG